MIPYFTHTLLEDPVLAHGFFGRLGGVSKGIYAKLNCGPGSGDIPSHVMENRRRVCAAITLEPPSLCTLYQVHSSRVITLDAPLGDTRPQADAMVTRNRGITLGILTADCAPVLLADTRAGVIGAAHAGWKGAHGGILEATVAAMEVLGAQRSALRALIGPCIHQSSYEVGPEFFARFEPHHQRAYFIASARAQHWQFDLPAFVSGQLHESGVGQVASLTMDTAADATQFFSYRRKMLLGEADYGRQISLIALRA